MELIEFNKILKKRKGVLVYFVITFIVIGLIATFLQPLQYRSKTRLLVVQSAKGEDPYTISKSNEYLGNLFSQVVYSNSFFNLVMDSKFNIDKKYFGNTSNREMKIWKKNISSKSLGDTGIISIDVYHSDPYQAKQISLAINDVLINKNFNYQGLGTLVRVTVIDQPIVSNYPVKPNIIINIILAIFTGIIIGLFYIYYFPEKKVKYHKRRTKKNHKKIINEINNIPDIKDDTNDISTITKDNEDYQGNINNVIKHY